MVNVRKPYGKSYLLDHVETLFNLHETSLNMVNVRKPLAKATFLAMLSLGESGLYNTN